ncbi:MAG: P-loop NTPase [Paracoccaceae bacterium]
MSDDVLKALRSITIPGMDSDVVSAGLVSDIVNNNGKVIFSITVPDDFDGDLAALQSQAERLVMQVEGVASALVVLTAERQGARGAPKAPPKLKSAPDRPVGPDMRPTAGEIAGVSSVIAVASGKGGVGKSTTAVNLAIALHTLWLRVGLLDADIYGPSVPRLLGITERPEIRDERIIPIEKFGLKIMSMGFLMDEEAPVIWRGPMVVSALMQMVREVNWGTLDVLVLDMPPGTGDAQLTMAQQVPMAGAIIVSTPQDLALVDARKGLKMFKSVDVPILGIIENMSTFICPHCGEGTDIFGHGGARSEARNLGVLFLGDIPLHIDIRRSSDAGTPVVVSDPDGPHAKHYKSVALKIATLLNVED